MYGTWRFLKNVMGLWIVQQCRATWAAAGESLSYEALTQLAESAEPLRSIIPVNDPRLLAPGNHPAIIRDLCRESGQPIPETKGQIIRCVLESLALKYRDVLDKLLTLSDKEANVLHIVGGGTQNQLLNQFSADATGLPVVTGPIEATVIGNALVQLIALGELRDLAEGRQLVSNSFSLDHYQPANDPRWDATFAQLYT